MFRGPDHIAMRIGSVCVTTAGFYDITHKRQIEFAFVFGIDRNVPLC